jgi:hypothetical protein
MVTVARNGSGENQALMDVGWNVLCTVTETNCWSGLMTTVAVVPRD